LGLDDGRAMADMGVLSISNYAVSFRETTAPYVRPAPHRVNPP
jgi:hypothetical protein